MATWLLLIFLPALVISFWALDRLSGRKLRETRLFLIKSLDVLESARPEAIAKVVATSQELVGMSIRTAVYMMSATTLAYVVVRRFGLNPYEDAGGWWILSLLTLLIGFTLGAVSAAIGARSENFRILAVFETMEAARANIVAGASDSDITANTRLSIARELRDAALFDFNLTVDSTLTSLELENMGPFKRLAWRLEPRVNILLGRNGYGKSYLLRLLAAAVANDAATLRRISEPNSQDRELRLNLERDGEFVSSTHAGDLLDGSLGQFPLLAIPDTRFIDRSTSSVSADDGELADLARTGARRFLQDRPFDTAIQTVLTQMCVEAIGLRQEGVTRPKTPQLDLVADVVRKLSEEAFDFHRIEQVGSGRFRILVETAASPDRPIGISQASQGTLSVIAIFGLIYQFLRATHPSATAEELCGCKGMVLIDEIDAHLHPAWQRQIVPLLRDRFPAVQFVLTAHSPLVVGGCGRGEVSVLVREKDGLRVVEHQRDFIGASFDEIYREIFEVEERDVTYLALNAKAPRLPELRREVEALQAQPGADQAVIDGKLETIDAIERLRRDEEHQLGAEQLRREHEQFRLENLELRRRLEQSASAVSADQRPVLNG